MDISLLWVLCIVRYKSLRRTDHSSIGVLPSGMCLWLCSLENEEVLLHYGLSRHNELYFLKSSRNKTPHYVIRSSTSLFDPDILSTGSMQVQCDAVWNYGSSEINPHIEDPVLMKCLKCILVLLIILTWFKFKAGCCVWVWWWYWTFGMCHWEIRLIYELHMLHALRKW